MVGLSVIPIGVELLRARRKGGEPEERDERYDDQAERDEVERKAFGA